MSVAASKPRASDVQSGVATYVYCLVRGRTRPPLPGASTAAKGREGPAERARAEGRLPGSGPPRLLAAGAGLWLVVADVPLATFGEAALARQLKDPEWVSACGLAHQIAIEACLHAPAVVPMTLFTIFATDARALEEVRHNAARLDASLDRVAGRTEWVVRVLRGERPSANEASVPESVQRSASVSVPRSASASMPPPVSGRAFLQAKASQRQATRRAAEEAEAAVRALANALAGVSDEVSYREATPANGSGAILDAAFLVPRPAAARFRREARRLARPLAERGFRVNVTGPWPGYSFVRSQEPS